MDNSLALAWQQRKRSLLFELGAARLKFFFMLRLRVIALFARVLALPDPP